MRIICAWCDAEIGSKKPLPNAEVTWGICRPCYVRIDSEAESMFRDAASSPALFPRTRAGDDHRGVRAQ